MTNEITTNETGKEITATPEELQRYPVLDPASGQRDMLANMPEPFNHVQSVMVKAGTGGATQWRFEDFDGEQVADLITGVVIANCCRWYLWPYDAPGSGASPYLVSFDGVTAKLVGDDIGELDSELIESSKNTDGTYDMKTLHYAQRGSAIKGKGPRMQRKRFLYILRPQTVVPVCVQTGAGSAINIDRFFNQCPTPCYQTEVNLALKSIVGAFGSYSQVAISRNADNVLSSAAAAFMKLNYYEPFQSSFLLESLNAGASN